MLNTSVGTSLFLTIAGTLVHAQEAATTAAGAPPAPPAWMQFMPFLVILVVFYFFLIRPQAKRQKEQQNFLSQLKAGDAVITQSGILGKISSINDNVISVDIAHGVTIKVLRSHIAALQSTLQNKTEG